MNRLSCLFVVLLAFGCRPSDSKLDAPLEHVSDLFFQENCNDKIISETNQILEHENSDDTKTLALLFKVGAYSELSQFDSAENVLSHLDTIKIKKSDNLNYWFSSIKGLYLFRINNYSEAYGLLSKVVSENRDERAKALALRILARIHFNSGDSNKATEFLAQSSELFKKEGLPKSVAINHKIIGRFYAVRKEFAKATERFDLAKTGLEKANDSIELFYIHINLITMKIFQGKYAEAKELAIKNRTYITDETDRQALALLYNNLGEIELLSQHYDSCRYYYSKTLELPKGYITDDLRCGNAFLGISKSYIAEGNTPKALSFALQALEIAKTSNLSELQYNSNLNLSELYKLKGQFDKSYFYLREAIPYLEKLGKKSVENSETVYNTTLNMIKLENEANEVKDEKRFYLYLIIAGVVFTMFFLAYTIITVRLQRSRNEILKALVKKNLQVIDDERKLNEALSIQLASRKLNRRSNDEEKDITLFNELTVWLGKEKQYVRKDITVDFVARELGTNRDYLAKATSSQQIHFNELINKFRIEEAVKILSNPSDKRYNYNLSIIASEVGFKSNSVFIEAFRKQTGMNPAQFRATVYNEEKKVEETT